MENYLNVGSNQVEESARIRVEEVEEEGSKFHHILRAPHLILKKSQKRSSIFIRDLTSSRDEKKVSIFFERLDFENKKDDFDLIYSTSILSEKMCILVENCVFASCPLLIIFCPLCPLSK